MNNKRWLGLIFVVALVPRLLFLWLWEAKGLEAHFGHDGYVALALHWIGLNPDLNSFGIHNPAPGFAFFCALVFKLTGGEHLLLIRLFNCLFSSLSCVLITKWAEKISTFPTARLTGLGMALAPMLIFFTPHLQSESFFIFFEILFFWCLTHSWMDARLGRALGLGVFLGALCLIRSAFAVSCPLILAALAWQRRKEGLKLLLSPYDL
jgi:4-amino-4-deoxy-L-arabinose transferase-like glycosyltransferase